MSNDFRGAIGFMGYRTVGLSKTNGLGLGIVLGVRYSPLVRYSSAF